MSKLKWRRDGRYHYYEDDVIGWGYVHPAAGGGYLAAAYDVDSAVKDTVSEGKRFVESAHRSRRKSKGQ